MFVDIIKAADLGWLATDNDQQSYQRLSQTSERVRFGQWWTFWAYYSMWTRQSRLMWH